MLAKKADEFIHKIKENNHILLTPFCEQEWFRGAYSTIQRTLHGAYRPLDVKAKNECSRFLTEGLLSIGKNTFDNEFKELILKLSKDFKISIGHSQKITSIFAKYVFCVFHARCEELPQKWIEFAKKHITNLPVPIDAFVLFAIYSEYENGFKEIKATRSKKANGEYYAPNSYILIDDQWTRWSRLSCYETYWTLQNKIRDIAKNEKMMPLEFEMHYLWPA